LASDPSTDTKVRKKILSVLASWKMQFDSDPSMSLVAGLYQQCKPRSSREKEKEREREDVVSADEERRREKAEKKKREKKEKEDKERAKRAEEERKRSGKNKTIRKSTFDFEKVC
jgi:hypothetical protein